ncbi:MAG: branched-chain amino acid ABC transporter substrate-binding protein, partial [Solirubrobacterales bacterium]
LVPRSLTLICLLVAAAALAGALSACGGDDDDGDGDGEVSGIETLPEEFCEQAEFGGEGEPDVLIASDLPMQGDSAERSTQMVEAIRLVLEQDDWQAGETKVAFQACDDSVEETGEWDKAQCKENAEAYAENPDLIGVVGTYNSGCAAVEIPILNRAPEGGVAMVSPGNTFVCLTQESPICEENEPDRFYPSGERNYARVIPNDAFQGAGLAQFATQLGVENPFVLVARKDPTSLGQGETFQNAAEALDMDIAGFENWNPKRGNYTELMEEVESSGADAVVLAGLLEQNGAQVIKDKVEVLGPNLGGAEATEDTGTTATTDDSVKLLAFDGFAQQATIDDVGPEAEGMFVSAPGRPPDDLSGAGERFVEQLSERVDGDVELFAPYAGQAAEVLLKAIAPEPDRADVVENLFVVSIPGGIVGNIRIEPSGDPSEGPISISVARSTFEPQAEIVPSGELAAAARGEDVDVDVDTGESTEDFGE